MEFEIVHIRSLFENATEGMVVTDSKGVIILVNPSACRMFGYEAPELKGQRIENIGAVKICQPSCWPQGRVLS